MGSICSEPAAGLCLVVTAVLGGMALRKLRKSPGQMGKRAICLAGLWGITCLLGFALCWELVLCSVSCVFLYMYLSSQELLPVDQKTILITGCDSGIGHNLAKYLDKLGFTVIAGVLHEKGSGAEELQRTCSSRLSVIQMDITNADQIREVKSKVAEKVQDRGLWALINNAGILGFPADGELIPITGYRKCMAVNFFGPVEVTKAFLPLLRKCKGRLVNISSMAARIPMVKLAAYASSKAALTMFSDILRQELSKWGIKVAVIHPGGFKTNIAGTEEIWDKMEKDLLDVLTPDVLEDYGQDYIFSLRNTVRSFADMGMSDFTPLLADVHHAISAKNPCALYKPGKESFLWHCIFSLLPTEVFDHIMKRRYVFEKGPSTPSTSAWKNKAT
ncbi:17-beta-hydroxysteroid dehydrogenase type 2 [Rhynchocyon petersi]